MEYIINLEDANINPTFIKVCLFHSAILYIIEFDFNDLSWESRIFL